MNTCQLLHGVEIDVRQEKRALDPGSKPLENLCAPKIDTWGTIKTSDGCFTTKWVREHNGSGQEKSFRPRAASAER